MDERKEDWPTLDPEPFEQAFVTFAGERGVNFATITARESLSLFVDFFAEVKFEGLRSDDLLFQWGVYKFERDWPESFEVNFTRQFIVDGCMGDDGYVQLELTLHYDADPYRSVGRGDFWASMVADMKEAVEASVAFREVADVTPTRANRWTGNP